MKAHEDEAGGVDVGCMGASPQAAMAGCHGEVSDCGRERGRSLITE